MNKISFKFIFPREKNTFETQTKIFCDKIKDKKLIYKEFKEKLINSILLHEICSESIIDKLLLSSYRSKLILNISKLRDIRFDPLTPSNQIFDENKIHLRIYFYDLYFIININEQNNFTFPYDINYLTILQCLETGFINNNLLILLESLKFNNFDSGKILTLIFDYRFNFFKKFYIILKINSLNISFYLKNKFLNQNLEIEQKLLIISNPKICLTPSPNVCRLLSVIDFNKKMWNNFNFKNEKDLIIKNNKNLNKIKNINKFEYIPLKEKIELPYEISSVFEKLNENKK